MKDALYIKSRLNELCSGMIPQNEDAKKMQRAKQTLLLWIYNNGQLRNDKEMECKLRNLKEELQVLNFCNTTGLPVKLLKGQISEITNIIQD